MHYIKNIILIFIALSIIIAQDYGGMQKGVIKGKVLDSLTEIPLEYATICIVKVESQDVEANFENCDYGMQADDNGIFFIKDIDYGYYQIEIDLMGYSPEYYKDALYPTHLMVDLEIIKLDPMLFGTFGGYLLAGEKHKRPCEEGYIIYYMLYVVYYVLYDIYIYNYLYIYIYIYIY